MMQKTPDVLQVVNEKGNIFNVICKCGSKNVSISTYNGSCECNSCNYHWFVSEDFIDSVLDELNYENTLPIELKELGNPIFIQDNRLRKEIAFIRKNARFLGTIETYNDFDCYEINGIYYQINTLHNSISYYNSVFHKFKNITEKYTKSQNAIELSLEVYDSKGKSVAIEESKCLLIDLFGNVEQVKLIAVNILSLFVENENHFPYPEKDIRGIEFLKRFMVILDKLKINYEKVDYGFGGTTIKLC